MRGSARHFPGKVRLIQYILVRSIGPLIRYRPNLSKVQLILRKVQVSPSGLQGTRVHRGRGILSRQERHQNPHLAREDDGNIHCALNSFNMAVSKREMS